MIKAIKSIGLVVVLILLYIGIGGIYAKIHEKIWNSPSEPEYITPNMLFWPLIVPFTFGKWVYDSVDL